MIGKTNVGGGGSQVTGSISIAENGTYDVSNYAAAVVSVPSDSTVQSILNGIMNGSLSGALTIPNSVTTIKPGVLENMSYITSIDFNNVTSIGKDECREDTALQHITISATTSIGENAFYNCKALKEINLGNSLTTIGSYAFYYAGYNDSDASDTHEVVLPSTLTSIGTYAFNYAKIYKLTGGSYNLVVNGNAFYYSQWMREVDLKIKNVSSNAFSYIENSSGMWGSLKFDIRGTMGSYAFAYNNYACSMNITNSVLTSLGDYAFMNFGRNRTIIAEQTTNSATLSGTTWYINGTSTGKTTSQIPQQSENVVTIKDGAYYINGYPTGCSASRMVIDFRNSTFTSIPQYCFYSDNSSYKLKNMDIYLPNTVTSVATYAFNQMTNSKIYFTGDVPTLASTSAFYNLDSSTWLMIPYAYIQNYLAATNWTSFSSKMKGYASADQFTLGETLPSVNTYGWALTWYSDINCTNQITTANGSEIYCLVGSRLYSNVWITAKLCSVIVSDGVNTYQNGDLIAVGTNIIITGTGDDPTYTFKSLDINGTSTYSNGDTYQVTTTDTTITIKFQDPANPVSDTFSDNDWATIFEADEAPSGWHIGDYKETTVDGVTVRATIVDLTAGRYKDGDNNNNKGVLELKWYNSTTAAWNQFYPTTKMMNSNGSNAGGWNGCEMRTWLNGTFKGLLASDIKAAMTKTWKIPAMNGGNQTGVSLVYSDDYIILASEKEIFGTVSYESSTEAAVETQFQQYASNNTSAFRIKYNSSGSAGIWWERSTDQGSGSHFCRVRNGGSSNSINADISYGVVPFIPF